MSDLAISFASLAKHNNGKFKSAAQRDFLLSRCDAGRYRACGQIFRNAYALYYFCDDVGITHVEKVAVKSGKTSRTWERTVDGVVNSVVATANKKEIARCKREIAGYAARLADRTASWDVGTYGCSAEVYTTCCEHDTQQLLAFTERLNQLLADTPA